VRDDGIGIRADEQPRIFERFVRGSEASARAIAGSGLGLAVAKSIADAHGGTISVESAESAGTRFRVSLPQASAR